MSVMLYKHPGQHDLPQHGGAFDYIVVDEDAVDESLAAGWCETPAAALKVADKPKRKSRQPASAD